MSKACLRATLIAGLVITAATVCAAPAGASRAANAKDRRALSSAVHTSPVGGIDKLPRSHYRVTGQRVSTVSKSWAIAQVVATRPFRGSFQNATVLAIKPAGTSEWVVVDVGTADVGCGIAPNKVLADLFKTKQPCPSGEGIG
jgi:hypothetical protein